MHRLFLVLICFFGFINIADAASKAESKVEVLTLGSAIVDHFFLVSDDQLKSITLEKGGWSPIDYPTLHKILQNNPNVAKMVPGGCGMNVIKGISRLGHKCSVIGKIGADEKGEFFLRNMKALGIDLHMQEGKLPTGQAICLITPDAERTFRSYHGASHSLSDLVINPKLFEEIKLFHIEGYQLVDRELVIRALKLAKAAGVKVSMDLASSEIVRRSRTFLHDILPKFVDILFCNESEAKELTGLTPKDACLNLSALCDIVTITMSERGAWTQQGKTVFYTPAFTVNAIDTTGAGDLFASGFLHGYLSGEPLQKSAWIGSLVASYVVKMVGAEIPNQIWTEIFERIDKEDPFKSSKI